MLGQDSLLPFFFFLNYFVGLGGGVVGRTQLTQNKISSALVTQLPIY